MNKKKQQVCAIPDWSRAEEECCTMCGKQQRRWGVEGRKLIWGKNHGKKGKTGIRKSGKVGVLGG